MNGDIGKIPSGAVYTASPEPQTPSAASVNDYSTLNGVVEPQESYSDAGGGSVPDAAPPLPPEAGQSSSSAPPGLPLDQLKQMLSSQLEYYFSRENLANDAYLISQMDNDQYVPIWTVANFNQVKKLTKDIKLITEVLRESPNVQVDEEGQKVRPSHKRCIVILREIPDSTPLEEVKGLFSGKNCPKLISCEFAHNNSWYVTFENDEDAQKAYRFLREEVREFQGKPIMARIKAKPMNRLPIPPVVSAIGTMKNGYRAPPVTTATTPAYDPTAAAAFPPAQQRFLYNGSSIPSVNYGSPVQIYTFQQQPFYSAGMLPHWGPSSPAYFEFGSVFSVNGLAPQASFAKAQGSRFNIAGTRNNRNKRSEHRSSVSESSSSRSYVSNKGNNTKGSEQHLGHMGGILSSVPGKGFYSRELVSQDSDDNITRISDSVDGFIQPILVSKDALPPRRRRKEEESRVSSSPGPAPVVASSQFDLEEEAFPPLPGLESSATPVPPPAHAPATASAEPLPEPQTHSHRENRLSDVVKGTAKTKPSSNSSVSVREKESGSPRPRSASPPPQSTPSQVSVTPLPLPLPTPPLTPEKTVPCVGAAKCCTADKATKTDDTVVNGEGPATTNAATMTDTSTTSPHPPASVSAQPSECSGGYQRLSYAQVAQHAKDKQAAERTEKLTVTTSTEDDKKDIHTLASGQTSPREGVGRGRGAPRIDRERGPRRRDPHTLLRPRSPK